MQQVSAGSGLQGSQTQGSVSSQSTRSVGDPPQSSRVTTSRPKKRERSDLTCDPVKQQRTDKGRRGCEDRETSLKPEASSLVGKDGGISSVASVDRLVCIMQYEWNDSAERQLDLVLSRTMLAKVVAITSERECLLKFLKLGGLAILDKWLQEAYRGKHFVNKEIPQDGERAVEDLLLALLGALERLPVDLVALKTCPVGKSVNLLRSHKHPDIQRRSKKLVDTWKKRVECEMKQSAEGKLSIDSALCVQQQEGGVTASKSQHAGYPEHPALHEISCGSRGKFASVASLCLSPEGQVKAPSTLIRLPSLADCPGDMSRKVNLSAPPARSYNGRPVSPCIPSLSSPDSEDGRSKSTVDVVSSVAIPQVSLDQVRGSKGIGASRNRRSIHVGSIKTFPTAPALSGSMIASKDSGASGSEDLQGVHAQSGLPLPCCSSSQKNPQVSLLYDGPTRSSLNSLSSCATDCNTRSSIQPYTCAEPIKAGIQLLANIAASESSMVDVKVSSPSETSAHVDIRACESRIPTVCVNALSPHDTTSETSLPSLRRRDGGKKSGSLASAQERVQAASGDLEKISLQPVEAVGESSAVDAMESKNTNMPTESEGFSLRTRVVHERPVFDLNEMLSSEEGVNQSSTVSGIGLTVPTQESFVAVSDSKTTFPVVPRAPITVVAAAKGSFNLPSGAYLPKGEFGWKGSAPTSAFRPTQPRHVFQKGNLNVAEQGTNEKVVMDFDLNVAAESGSVDHDMGLRSSTTIRPAMHCSNISNFGGSIPAQKASGTPGAAWDLNQVDEGVAEAQGRPDFDLNSGPASQDNDDVVLSNRHQGIRAHSISDNTNFGASHKLPSHPFNSGTPIMMPAFAMSNPEFPYPLGAASPWPNSGPPDGMFQYNILLPNQSGLTCPPLSSMPSGSYGGIPFGFSPASMQGFSAPFMDTLRGPHTGALSPASATNGEQSFVPSQTKTPPYMIGVLTDAIQHQGRGGFWSRSTLDLNAGPDGVDVKNLKDDRWHMLPMNEQIRTRHQVMDMSAVLKQREQEGCFSMPDGRQGALMKQPVWR